MTEDNKNLPDLSILLKSEALNEEPSKWMKASEIKDPHKRMEAYSKLIVKERNEKPYPRKFVKYNFDNKSYYVMHGFDFCSNAVIVDERNKGLLANYNSSTKIETQTSLIYCILDDCEDQLFLPDNLQEKSFNMIKENHLESFRSELNRYCFANADQKPEKHPLQNIDPKAAELVNMMLENFSLVTAEKEFPAPQSIIAVETLTL